MKKKNAVAVRERKVVLPADQSPAAMIQMAVAGKADLAQLKGLLDIQKEYEANQAKKAYYKAMTAFKAKLPTIDRNRKVSYPAGGGSTVKYSYATLFNAIDKVTPILSDFGLSVAWFHKQTEKELSVTCRITHELGYSEETSLTGPHDNTGSKNAIQALGSTNSYLERYTFFALIGAAAKDQDDDGQASGKAATELITPKQLSELLDIIDNNNVSKQKFYAFLNIQKLEDLKAADFQKAKTALNNIITSGKP